MARQPSAKQSFLASEQARGRTKGQAEYAWRIAQGAKQGLSVSQSRGHARKSELSKSQIKERQRAPTPPAPKGPKFIGGESRPQHERAVYHRKDRIGKAAEIDVSKQMTPAQQAKYDGLVKAKKPKAAKVYALSEVYGVPPLAGGLEWDDDFPYDDFEDWEDIPDYDGDYAAED